MVTNRSAQRAIWAEFPDAIDHGKAVTVERHSRRPAGQDGLVYGEQTTMGITYGDFIFIEETGLVAACKTSTNSCRALMLGRLKVTLMEPQIAFAAAKYNIPPDTFRGYSERLLKRLGCTYVDSLDASSFEEASVIWNLNSSLKRTGLRSDLSRRFDLILDNGTSEHVFNPAQSVANSMEMLREGGRLNLVLPIRGWCDHGFYQFSPAFFYALENEWIALERCYFYVYDRRSTRLRFWDGLQESFKEHIHGAFDGSYMANLFEFLHRPVNSWVILRKKKDLDEINFLENTNQLIYLQLWKSNQNGSAPLSREHKLKIWATRVAPLTLRSFIFRRLLNHSRADLSKVERLSGE